MAAQAEQPQEQLGEELQQKEQSLEQQCHICMSAISNAAAVKGCGHEFCYNCIHQWVGSRTQPLCPVCRTDIKTLLLADGSEEAAQPATSAPSEDPDLSCLDHAYFLGEVNRLLSRGNTVHDRLYREAYGCSRKGGSRLTQLSLEGVQEVLGALNSYKSTIESEVRFDPHVMLQELYRLDRQLTSLQSGSSSSMHQPTGAADEHHAPGSWHQRQSHAANGHEHLDSWSNRDFDHDYCYDDHDDHDYHDYDFDGDEDDEDDWHEGLSRTPGRRPAQRHVVKHLRSNSGGGQQQQQQQRGAAPGQRRQQQQQQQRGRGR